jgi:hypothetical protein
MFGEEEERNEPIHHRGIVAGQSGLYFIGLFILYAISSGFLPGLGRDAEHAVKDIASGRPMGPRYPPRTGASASRDCGRLYLRPSCARLGGTAGVRLASRSRLEDGAEEEAPLDALIGARIGESLWSCWGLRV